MDSKNRKNAEKQCVTCLEYVIPANTQKYIIRCKPCYFKIKQTTATATATATPNKCLINLKRI
jgi:hypothetical protein